MSVVRVEVRAKGATALLFECTGPNPVFPRVGEQVEFGDGVGVVETVTWKPLASGRKRNADMLIVVECVPAPTTGSRR